MKPQEMTHNLGVNASQVLKENYSRSPHSNVRRPGSPSNVNIHLPEYFLPLFTLFSDAIRALKLLPQEVYKKKLLMRQRMARSPCWLPERLLTVTWCGGETERSGASYLGRCCWRPCHVVLCQATLGDQVFLYHHLLSFPCIFLISRSILLMFLSICSLFLLLPILRSPPALPSVTFNISMTVSSPLVSLFLSFPALLPVPSFPLLSSSPLPTPLCPGSSR